MDQRLGFTICLVGQSGSGKSSVAEVITKKYLTVSVSLSDELRLQAAAHGLINPSRKELQLFATELRGIHGNDILARIALSRVELAQDSVVEGIRHPEELAHIKNSRGPDFLVCGLYTSLEARFQRVRVRARASDEIVWEKFVENDKREWGEGGSASSQNTRQLMEQADVMIPNFGTKPELADSVISLMNAYLRHIRRELEGSPTTEDDLTQFSPRKEWR